jgi:hypothetical protein
VRPCPQSKQGLKVLGTGRTCLASAGPRVPTPVSSKPKTKNNWRETTGEPKEKEVTSSTKFWKRETREESSKE